MSQDRPAARHRALGSLRAPLPPAELNGWQLRAVLLCVCLLAVVTVVHGETAQRLGIVSLVGTVVVVTGTVALPGTAMPTAFLVVLVLAVLDREDASVLRLVLAAALVHAIHLLAAVCALGPPSTRFDVAALLPSARRWALSQLVALPVALTVWVVDLAGLRGRGVVGALEVAAGAVAALLLAGTVALARRRVR